MAESRQFALTDYLVFIAVLCISSLIGIYYSITEKNVTADSFLMGDRNLPLLPVALSLLVSFQSAILILGSTAEMYTRGTTYWWSTVGISISAVFTCFIFVPVFYHLKLTSVYEYLQARFESKFLRKIGAGLYILITVVYLSIAMYAPSIALAAVSDLLPIWALILLAGVVCTFYVFVGGMKAVIWTDAVQAFVMLGGLLSIAVMGTMEVGSIGEVWRLGREHGRINYFDSRMDPFLYMTSTYMIFGQTLSWLGWYGINQSAVQRYCGMATLRKGQLFVCTALISLVCYCGLVMFAYYADCDPLKAGIVGDRDQLLPYLVITVMDAVPGIAGLFVACLYAGTLSTVSSGLNSLAAVTYEDFLYDLTVDWKPDQIGKLTKALSLAFGVVSTGMSFLTPLLGGILQAAISVMGAINGPLTGMFVAGVLLPWVNRKGVLVGVLLSAFVTISLCTGGMVVKPHSELLPTSTENCMQRFNLSVPIDTENSAPEEEDLGMLKIFSLTFVLYDAIGVIIVMIVSLPVSIATGTSHLLHLDPCLVHPMYTKWLKNLQGGKEEHSPTIEMSTKQNGYENDALSTSATNL